MTSSLPTARRFAAASQSSTARRALALGAAACLWAGTPSARAIQDGTQKPPAEKNLKPGEYVWDAATANQQPDGAIDVVVSLAEQMLYAYRNGTLVGRSTISSGRPGHETPPGIYMILEKERSHHSNKYHEAAMPYMERLTWDGLAIHAGNTPGHPESHGCMHVPEDFAKDLYGYTQEGNTVLVAQGTNRPQKTAAPNLLFAKGMAAPTPKAPAPSPSPTPAGAADKKLGTGEASTAENGPGYTWDSKKVPSGPYLLVFTSADKRVYAYRQGVEIGRADLDGAALKKPFGGYVYTATAEKGSKGKPQWSLLGKSDNVPAPNLSQLAKGLKLPQGFVEKVQGAVRPGTTLVLTDKPIKPDKAGDEDKED